MEIKKQLPSDLYRVNWLNKEYTENLVPDLDVFESRVSMISPLR